ncbi:MAG: hypothetical protein ACFFAS_00295 [Promethearchaeota archaeon]
MNSSTITIDKHYVEELLEEYARAIDILGLADFIPIEEHLKKINKIKKIRNTLKRNTKLTLDLT